MSKRSYTDIVISLETSLGFIENHLKNIDQHLNKLNERTGNCEVATTKNTTNIRWIIRIGGGAVGSGGVLAGILKLAGVY